MWNISESQDRKGYFIAIEGIDSSGKKTQAERLLNHLEEKYSPVKYIEFPSYEETEFGKLVSKFLRGEFGDRDEVPVEVISILYALDRYQLREELENFLSKGGIIVANRYTQSNLAFQTAEIEGAEWEETVDWMINLERRLPQPDQVVVLDMDPKKARKLMDQKSLRDYLNGDKLDINEEKLN